jgi:hypothetical protein
MILAPRLTTGCSGARATGVFAVSEGRCARPLNQVLAGIATREAESR